MKRERQKKILELIEKYEIETQDDLIEHLKESGFDVTQATISRDIRELKLTKGSSHNGVSKYAAPSVKKEHVIPRFSSALTDSITKVDYAGNLIIIKTYPGMANAVATCVDSLNLDDIIGCVAGDDAILVVVRNDETAAELSDKIREMITTI
jgi:transcriptional regulator of arginine metabolism